LFVTARVQRKGYGHSGKHHCVIERNQHEPCHRANHMHIVDVVNY
jgi:hypothetical protein